MQIRKRLVVFLNFVVLRLDVFDQSRFDQQGIDFAFAIDEVDVGNLVDPVGGPLFLGSRFEKITAGPRAKIRCFSNIDHDARLHFSSGKRPAIAGTFGLLPQPAQTASTSAH